MLQTEPGHLETIEESESSDNEASGEHAESLDGKSEDNPKHEEEEEEEETLIKCFQEWTTKDILKGISLYFNPGSMIGIMGSSGCGKTTFLDLLTGRRRGGKFNVKYTLCHY